MLHRTFGLVLAFSIGVIFLAGRCSAECTDLLHKALVAQAKAVESGLVLRDVKQDASTTQV
jgi:hypothetical protein